MKQEKIKVTVLSENTSCGEFEGEHGLSLLIEYKGEKILLDAGRSALFSINADKLGIDLKDVDKAVLSHSHYDHADGFDTFFEINDKAKLYLNANCSEDYYSGNGEGVHYIGPKKGMLEKHKDRLVLNDGISILGDEDEILFPHTIFDETIGEKALLYKMEGELLKPDMYEHEQSLVLRTERGLVIFNSCSHTGVANILKETRQQFPNERIAAYVGGFHLFEMSEEDVRAFAETIKDEKDMRIITGHCTGDAAFDVLKEFFSDNLIRMHAGMIFEL